ncbi:F-box/RNI/FBD-like domain protein, partial [Trifolium medium]|nr:F-box/RNI/FBD-like domain protein [Trifolium medium]
MYLHLQNCRLVAPMDFSGLKNLRTLVLQLVDDVKQTLLEGLFSNCIHLVDFTLDECEFNSDLKIITPTLLHLNIVNCQVKIGEKRNIDIIASNLSSIEYSCNRLSVHDMKIDAHMLSKFSFRGCKIYEPVGFSGLKNVTTIVFDGLSEFQPTNIIPLLFSECFQLEDVTFINIKHIPDMNIISPKLRHLKIIECGYPLIDINVLNLASFEYS